MKRSNHRISVITIFYNAEAYFVDTIASVLAQDFKLLQVDDGSTDGSTTIGRGYVARFPDRIRDLEHDRHRLRRVTSGVSRMSIERLLRSPKRRGHSLIRHLSGANPE